MLHEEKDVLAENARLRAENAELRDINELLRVTSAGSVGDALDNALAEEEEYRQSHTTNQEQETKVNT
ncbi:hypothetical protein [Trueperella bialowiezensis]|uniref:Uncharacterized protein n=1 Tax=Trueperella bialowiezensis TaxID=312285 RepID=A0A448PEV8_9ACTO|nr:hypothetical protein [Trueperella bialowiezensis]VEI13457.1 Uncharacterised protein [Trueperella bialowiezensis]